VDSVHVTLTTFAVILGGATLGFVLRKCLQERHLSSQTQDVVKLATGVIATLTALVLGLLIATAKQTFDARVAQVRTFTINLTMIDHSMRLYEPPLNEARAALAKFATSIRDRLWGPDPTPHADLMLQIDYIRNVFRQLDPHSLQNESLKARFMALSDVIVLSADELLESDDAGIPVQIIEIVDGWLGIIFLGFALFAPFNRVSVAAMILGAATVAMALFLIIEMDGPFQGFIVIPIDIMNNAIGQISRG
jgi:hypothetical protein